MRLLRAPAPTALPRGAPRRIAPTIALRRLCRQRDLGRCGGSMAPAARIRRPAAITMFGTAHCPAASLGALGNEGALVSGAAKRLAHDLFGARRIGVAGKARLILVGPAEHRQERLKARIVRMRLGRGDRLLDEMVAGD